MIVEPSDFGLEEFRALRATIRERGTVRLIVMTITIVSWAGLALAVASIAVVPALGLVPLLVLAAGFEVIFASHVGVERVGRFLQARYESPGRLPGWEHAAMALARHPATSGGIDPLFSALFVIATLMNLGPIALLSVPDGPEISGFPAELLASLVFHVAFVARILIARQFAGRQRARDLELFQKAPAARP